MVHYTLVIKELINFTLVSLCAWCAFFICTQEGNLHCETAAYFWGHNHGPSHIFKKLLQTSAQSRKPIAQASSFLCAAVSAQVQWTRLRNGSFPKLWLKYSDMIPKFLPHQTFHKCVIFLHFRLYCYLLYMAVKLTTREDYMRMYENSVSRWAFGHTRGWQ